MIHITSTLHGVEVGGMRHPAQTVHYTEEQISPEALAEMQASSYLTVEIDQPEKPKKAAKTKTDTDTE